MNEKSYKHYRGFICCTFAEPQLLCKFLIGCQALCLHIRNKHKLLQGGGTLQLLPAGSHSGVQTADLDSTSNNVVKVTVYVYIHS